MKMKARSMVSSLRFPLLLLSIGLGVTPQIYPQQGICEVHFSVLNTDRYVYGPVETECATFWFHSAPFGNWGVKTETSDKKDGHQFDGWCHDKVVLVNESVPPGVRGRYKTYCGDDWYEWNSCTSEDREWRPPNSDFYNYNNDTQQKSTRGVNHHGSGISRLGAPCPDDSDGDGYKESGGCKEALAGGFSVSGHRIALYELDPGSPDAEVETLRFPALTISAATVDCDYVDYCGASGGGEWESPTSSSSSKTSAKAVIAITRAVFSDPYSQCCDRALSPSGCSVPGGGGWGF